MDQFEKEKIDAMLFETDEFLKKLNEFRDAQRISSPLLTSFEAVLNSIEAILDNQPTLIEYKFKGNCNENVTNENVNLNENSIKRKYFCDLCVDNIPGNYNSLHSHVGSLKHKHKRRKFLALHPTSSKSENSFNDPGIYNSEKLQQIYSDILPTEVEEKLNQEKLSKLLLPFMRITSEKYLVHLFGSRLYCMSNELSDFNIFLEIKDESLSTEDQNSSALSLFKLLSTQPIYKMTGATVEKQIWRRLESPTIGVNDVELDIPFKLTFSNGSLRIQQGQLIKYLFQNPLHRKICIAFNLIGRKFGFPFKPYQSVLLVLYYYQIREVLPPICNLKKILPSICSEGWESSFSFEPHHTNCDKKEYLIDNYKNFKLNLTDFFEFYIDFDFENYIICPYLGNKLLKTEFDKRMSSIPSYNEFFVQNPGKDIFKILFNKMGNMQDPIQLNANLSLRPQFIKMFQKYSLNVARTGVIDFI